MKELRKQSEIWEAVDVQRPKDLKELYWRRSYLGIKAALEHVGLSIITTKEEFDALSIPKDKAGHKRYLERKIIVTRNGIQSKPTQIKNLLSGASGLLTKEELNVILQKVNDEKSLNQPKGIPTNNDKESNAIKKLNKLLDIESYLDIEYLIEHRIADIAYCFKNDNDENYVSDQVKTAYATKNQINFSIKVGEMITILEKNMSLTFISINNNEIDIVWFFYGINAIDILKTFEKTKVFQPSRQLKCKSDNPFTLAIENFRYDVGSCKKEIDRLLQQKLEFVKIGVKNSIQYLNEDDSQIMCSFHRIEHKSFAMTRDACAKINVNVKKYHEDNYTCVDFRIEDTAELPTIKVQDKTYKKHIRMRPPGKLPYNPDMIDIFQCSNLTTNEVYAIPMRYYDNDVIKSTFLPEILMKTDIKITTNIWAKKYSKYKFDFKIEKDVYAYVETCRKAAAIPPLSDRDFYKNLIDANKDQFGSLKQLKERKNE